MLKRALKNFLFFLGEFYVLAKAVMSSFWFWLIPIFLVGLYISFWMMFVIHPLSILISPSLIILCIVYVRERQAKKKKCV